MRNPVLLLWVMSAYGAFGQTVVFNASSTALAGDVVYLQGSGFGPSPKVRYSFNDMNWVSLTPLTASAQVVMLQMPASLTRLPDLMTVQVSADGYNWSASAYLNRAKAYSFDTNQVAPGGSFRVFGRNLIFARTPSVRLVDLADGSSHYASVNTSASSAYALSATASWDIQANHNYSVYVSNGYGGNSSTSLESLAATTLLGRAAGNDYFSLGVPWAADLNYTGNVYNIQTDPRLGAHATGYGSVSDRDAINWAIWTASQAGGGIVYLPAGTYTLYYSNGCGITLHPRVSVVGAGVSNTFINYGFGTPPAPGQGGHAACFGTTQAGFSDITFNNVNLSGQWPQSAQGLNGNEVFLQRTNWNLANAQWVIIQNATNVTVQNTNIVQGLDPSYNGPLSMQGSTNVVLRGNSIKYVAGALVFDQTTNAIFENNHVTRDASQVAPAWVVTHVVVGNFANNFTLLQNIFDVTGGTLIAQNDGETIGSESGGINRYDEFRGTVQGGFSNAIFDGAQNFNYSTNNAVPNLRLGATLAIVGGQGAGQWATVTGVSADGHTVWVNQPWAVPPAAGSTYATFDWGAASWIIAGNYLANNEKGIEFFDASIRDILISNNTLSNNGEILLTPTEQPNGAGLFNLILNTQILGNTLTDTNYLRPAAISAVPREDGQTTNFGTAIIGLEIRGNSITGSMPNTLVSNTALDDSKALSEGINLYWQWQTLGYFSDSGIPSSLGTIVQDNSLTNSAVGYEINSGDYQTVFAGNSLNNVASVTADATVPGALHASVGTVSNGAKAASTGGAAIQLTTFLGGVWNTQQANAMVISTINFGASGYVPIPGDYDGDGLVDCAVFTKGIFYVRPSSNPNNSYPVYFSNPTDVPMPGDYDGDGKTDVAVFRPGTGQWFYAPSGSPSSATIAVQTQAGSADIPMPGDYDGDGKTDFVFFRPATGTFFLKLSSNLGATYATPFGISLDVPVAGDYDGDGKTDLAVFRPSNGGWYYRPSSNPSIVLTQLTQGQAGDIPVPGDYDGDGKSDYAFWRPATQTWYIILSSNPGATITAQGNGTPLGLTPNATAVKASLTVQ